MPGSSVFLDTMIYLHFVPVEQIDFLQVLGTSRVTILLPRVTLKELEKHKTNHSSGRIRSRARQTLAFLERQVALNLPFREGVSLEFVPNMPKLDLEAHGLNPLWNDDLLIASVLELKQSRPNDDPILITDDAGARLTCHHLGVRTFTLPETLRLPAEVDDDQKELRRLQRELQAIKGAQPKIVVGFADTLDSVGRFVLAPPATVNESSITDSLNKIKALFPEIRKPDLTDVPVDRRMAEFAKAFGKFEEVSDQEYQRYNKERLAYFESYERYLRSTTEAENRVARSIRFTIALTNTGSVPADDVDIRLLFPNGFSLCSEEDIPSLPKRPKQPVKPRTRTELMTSEMVSGIGLNWRPSTNIPDLGLGSNFQLRKTNSYEVTDHFERVKHGQSDELPLMFLTFDSYEQAASFHCSYELNVGNLRTAVKGDLHFVIERTE